MNTQNDKLISRVEKIFNYVDEVNVILKDLEKLRPNVDEKTQKKIDKILDSEITPIEELKKEVKKIKALNKPKKLKFSSNQASAPMSVLNEGLTKKYNGESIKTIDPYTKKIISNKFTNCCGEIYITDEYKTIEKYDRTPESQILKNYTNMCFTREELQIYFALIDVYLRNVSKKDFGETLEIPVKDFHEKVLKRCNRIRPEDLKKYKDIFIKLANKRIQYNSSCATSNFFNKKALKDLEINSSLVNIDIITDNISNQQVIELTPSTYTKLELTTIKQFTNFFPIGLITLAFDKHPNILFFGLYLIRMHRINQKSKTKDPETHKIKTIENKIYAWEIGLNKLIENGLQDGNEIINALKSKKEDENYIREKTTYFKRKILNPLIESLEILEQSFCLKNLKINELKKLKYKNLFDETKIKLYFNYEIPVDLKNYK